MVGAVADDEYEAHSKLVDILREIPGMIDLDGRHDGPETHNEVQFTYSALPHYYFLGTAGFRPGEHVGTLVLTIVRGSKLADLPHPIKNHIAQQFPQARYRMNGGKEFYWDGIENSAT